MARKFSFISLLSLSLLLLTRALSQEAPQKLSLPSLCDLHIEAMEFSQEDGHFVVTQLFRRSDRWQPLARSLEREFKPTTTFKRSHYWMMQKHLSPWLISIQVGMGRKRKETLDEVQWQKQSTGVVKVFISYRYQVKEETGTP